MISLINSTSVAIEYEIISMQSGWKFKLSHIGRGRYSMHHVFEIMSKVFDIFDAESVSHGYYNGNQMIRMVVGR